MLDSNSFVVIFKSLYNFLYVYVELDNRFMICLLFSYSLMLYCPIIVCVFFAIPYIYFIVYYFYGPVLCSTILLVPDVVYCRGKRVGCCLIFDQRRAQNVLFLIHFCE